MTKTSAASSASAPRLCPTCGTRVGAAATKCLVCGADLTAKADARGGSRVRAITAGNTPMRLPSPLLLVLLAMTLVAAVVVFIVNNNRQETPQVVVGGTPATATATVTGTLSPSATPTATASETPAATDTPQPPLEYSVVAGDSCASIAGENNVSIASIIQLNGLDPNCTLSVGRLLQIPLPTATVTPYPTATLGAVVSTQVPRTTYVVHAGDTLLGIANFYGLTVADLMEVNGISDPTAIRVDDVLIIPLERAVTPGPSPTPTPPLPWPAPNLLVPADGQDHSAADTTVTLQWTSVGTLRANEYYYVEVEDVTCGCARFVRQATTETRYIVPVEFRPTDSKVHVYRWTVTTVRLRPGGSAQPEYESAGTTSAARTFTWVAAGAQ